MSEAATIDLNPDEAALVLVDLQAGILGMNLAPRTGTGIVDGAKELAERFAAAGALVVVVRVAFSGDAQDLPPQRVDTPMAIPEGGFPSGWADVNPALLPLADVVITKRHWGAFTGTELDLQLRRRGVRAIVMGGIATNFGVESTVRNAWELGYNVVVCEDLCASAAADLHEFAVSRIFPRVSRVTRSHLIRLDGRKAVS